MILSHSYTHVRLAEHSNGTSKTAGYQLWVTENGKRYILIAFSKDLAELYAKETKELLIKRVRDAFIEEPPWEQLGWLIDRLVVSSGELDIQVVSEGNLKS